MNRIFLFSRSFIANMLYRDLTFILDETSSELVILKEYKLNINTIDNIVVVDTIDEAMLISNITIVVENEDLPKHSIKKIVEMSERTRNKCVFVPDFWAIQADTDSMNKQLQETKSNCPTIVDIALGINAQQIKIEMILNRILNELEIDFRQFFSLSTRNFFLFLNRLGILNANIQTQIEEKCKSWQLNVYSVDIGNRIEKINDYSDFLNLIQPDFVILQTDMGFNNFAKAEKLIINITQSSLDFIVKTHMHTTADNIYTVYCDTRVAGKRVLDIDSPHVEKRLRNAILTKLSYPSGIMPLS